MRATPDFDFALTESAQMIREVTARFADEQIAPLAARAVHTMPPTIMVRNMP